MSELWCAICRVAVDCSDDMVANGVTICVKCWEALRDMGWHHSSYERYVICEEMEGFYENDEEKNAHRGKGGAKGGY